MHYVFEKPSSRMVRSLNPGIRHDGKVLALKNQPAVDLVESTMRLRSPIAVRDVVDGLLAEYPPVGCGGIQNDQPGPGR